uniref:DUF4283 domain-containing protein n=1 Tax=Setaria italica TaxID=4555 RepID=K4AIT4_SETIT
MEMMKTWVGERSQKKKKKMSTKLTLLPMKSYFFVEENIDSKTAREKASTTVITVISGELTAKQLEMEFRNIISGNLWKWTARKVAENKFRMRFPIAKMVVDYNNFKLGLLIEPWNSTMGAKGKLQQARFKVRGIPTNQRAMRTIAKVCSLVGKTMTIDEKIRFN